MQVVGAALGHQGDLGAGGAAQLRAGIGGDGPEFFHRVERHSQHAGESRVVLLVVHVHAVERDVGLVVLAAVDRPAAVIGPIAQVRYTRFQGKKPDHVPRLKGQLRDRLSADGVADGGVRRVHLLGFGRHRNHLRQAADLLERNVDGGRRIDQQLDVIDDLFGEAGGRGYDLVFARLHLGEGEAAGHVGLFLALRSGRDVGQAHRGRRDNRARRVVDGAIQGS